MIAHDFYSQLQKTMSELFSSCGFLGFGKTIATPEDINKMDKYSGSNYCGNDTTWNGQVCVSSIDTTQDNESVWQDAINSVKGSTFCGKGTSWNGTKCMYIGDYSKELISGAHMGNLIVYSKTHTHWYDLGVCKEDVVDKYPKCTKLDDGHIAVKFDVPKELNCSTFGQFGIGNEMSLKKTIENEFSNTLIYATSEASGWTDGRTKVICSLPI